MPEHIDPASADHRSSQGLPELFQFCLCRDDQSFLRSDTLDHRVDLASHDRILEFIDGVAGTDHRAVVPVDQCKPMLAMLASTSCGAGAVQRNLTRSFEENDLVLLTAGLAPHDELHGGHLPSDSAAASIPERSVLSVKRLL